MKSEILSSVKKAVIEVLELDADTELSEKTRLKEELGLGSLNSLALIIKIEEMLDNFTVDPEEFEPEHLNTIENLCFFIEKQINKS